MRLFAFSSLFTIMESPLKRFLASASVAALVLVAPISSPQFIPGNSGIAWAQSAVVLENLSFKGDLGTVSIPKITVEGLPHQRPNSRRCLTPGP
jgi:hypothetical protein